MSDDGQNALTIIVLIGSVFSPYYAWSGRQTPLNHCAFNIALYGNRGHRWTMTERGQNVLARTYSSLAIGPSSIAWDGTALTLDLDEVTVPIPGRVRGQVRLYPSALNARTFGLDGKGRHRWRPIAPLARVEVELSKPDLSWAGSGYLDSNEGDEPLETAFKRWDWSRADAGEDAIVLYDVTERDNVQSSIAVYFRHDGSVEDFEAPRRFDLPGTLWRVARGTQSDSEPKLIKTLEDTPFYARSMISSQLLGTPITAMHESLDLDRFNTQWVKMLLPFRMPRSFR